jgi:polysaccharide export outer membrane protein
MGPRGWYSALNKHAINSMICAVVAGLVFASSSWSQEMERAPASAMSFPEGSIGNLPTQPVGPNDLLAVSVYDSPELTRTVRVDRNGNIRLPMIENPIKVQGMFPAQVESAIAQSLKTGNVMVDPIVTVTIVEYQSRPINVVGAVRNPVVFQATHPTSLLDAIARAGGIREDAGSDILVRHEITSGESNQWVTETVPVRQLIDQADPKLNITLRGGEEVLVPEAKGIYVVGNVKKPGAFPVRNDEGTTVLQALALSEGLMPYTAKEAYIYRRTSAGSRSEVPIPLSKIMQRKSPDIALEANDILYIPDSKGKRLTAATLDRIVGIGGQTAAYYVIWH